MTVPKDWEGTVLSAEGGPAVLADYGDIEVIQSPPFRLTTPAGFPFGRFMELTFRVFGRPEDEARRLGQQLAENPALVMHFPGASAVRNIPLRTGMGVLVGNPDGNDGMCFFWSTPARIYIIEADKLSESRAVAVADSIREDQGHSGRAAARYSPQAFVWLPSTPSPDAYSIAMKNCASGSGCDVSSASGRRMRAAV